MSFQFNAEQLADLANLRASGNYADAYAYVSNAITTVTTNVDGEVIVMPSMGVPANVWQWFQGAEQVNRGTGPFSDFIREYTEEQYRIRTGAEPASNFTQNGSNAIAFEVIGDILNNGVLPTLAQIGQRDATKSVEAFPNADAAAWSGNILFVPLGDRSFLDQYLLSNAADPYNLLAAFHSAYRAGGITYDNLTLGGFMTAFGTGISMAFGAGATIDASLIASAGNSIASYFTSMYGSSAAYLPLHGITVDVLGRSGTISGTSNGELIYGADGADTFALTAGSDILDGGSGNDTALYQGSSSMSVVIGPRTSAAAYVGNVFGAGGDISLFNVEHIVTGSGQDSFKINGFSSGVTSLTIDAGAGSDTISFEDLSDGITFDETSGVVSGLGAGLTLAGIDKIIGSGGNDTFKMNDTSITVVGKGGTDTLDFSGAQNGVSIHTDSWIGIENFIGTDVIDSFFLDGTEAHDVKLGGGNDGVLAGAGADRIDGGADFDTLSYENSSAGVWVDADVGFGAYGDAEGDLMTNIEKIIGSAHKDTFISGGGVEYWGGGGDDTMWGGFGSTFYGEGGADTLTYANYSGAVTVNVQNALTSTGDRYYGVENIIGSQSGDTFVGLFTQGAQRVTLNGGIGNDVFQVGTNVSANGGADADTFTIVSTQAGSVNGGDGIDTVYFTNGGRNTYDMRAGTYDQYDYSSNHIATMSVTNMETVYLSNGINTVYGRDGGAVIVGGGFQDVIYGGSGVDYIYANGFRTQDNGIHGGGGNDFIYGTGYDNLYGDGGSDTIFGGANNDYIYGGADPDELHGGDGNDVIRPGFGGGNVVFGDGGDQDMIWFDFTYENDPYTDSSRLLSIREGAGGWEITTEQGGVTYVDTAIDIEYAMFAGQGWQLTPGFEWFI